ncbi:MAG TPA: MerR family transcriptional regulator [Chthoniobacterales bacterium]|nr:MerR family transcriptional regulator [Chthoniobacterales bacterium]
MLIGEPAASAGIKPDSVRFYEGSRLLPKPARNASGYRVYGVSAVTQLRFIKKAQSLGFSLDEVKRILNLHGQGNRTCRCLLGIAEATLAKTELKLREIQQFPDTLSANLNGWKKLPRRRKRTAEFCVLIESSTEAG